MSSPLRLFSVGILTTGLGLGCGLIVTGTLDRIACDDSETLAKSGCPGGMFCAGGECALCRSVEDCSNGLDDDCDDAVDELDDDCQNEEEERGGCFATGCAAGLECVTLEIGSPPQCLQPCYCSSKECPDGTVCKHVPNKLKAWCLTLEQAELSVNELGTRAVGETCEQGDDCRSGRCAISDGGVCVDVCCSWRGCPYPMICELNTYSWECTMPESSEWRLMR